MQAGRIAQGLTTPRDDVKRTPSSLAAIVLSEARVSAAGVERIKTAPSVNTCRSFGSHPRQLGLLFPKNLDDTFSQRLERQLGVARFELLAEFDQLLLQGGEPVADGIGEVGLIHRDIG